MSDNTSETSDAPYEKETDNEWDDDLASIVGSDEENVTLYTSEVKEMLTVYERGVKVIKSQTVKTEILRLVRKIVIPYEKFVSEGSYIGSFERPDFTDKETWYSIVLHQVGYNQHKARTLAKVWMTYRGDISEVFSNHRSYVTQTMKKAFLVGEKKYTWYYYIVLILFLADTTKTIHNTCIVLTSNLFPTGTTLYLHWALIVIILH